MDVAYVNPFISATVKTFEMMMKCDVKPGAPTVKKDASFSFDISGVIGLSGDALGAIALSFPKDVALKAVSAMIGSECTEIDYEVTDGIGEITNIIAGNAKIGLSKFNLSISLPNIIIGKDHTIQSLSDIPALLVPFASTIGNFSMEVALKTP